MKAGDMMTTGAASVHPWDMIGEAVRAMVDYGVSGLPVIDADGKPVGMITERDLLQRIEIGTERKRPRWLELWMEPGDLAEDYARAHGRKVEDVMTRDPVCIDTEMPADEVVDLMERKGFKRLPVIHGGKLVGIVSRANVLRALSRRLEEPQAAIQDDLVLRRKVLDAIRSKAWSEDASVDIHVRDGTVTLRGMAGDGRVAQAMRIAAENMPGVKNVRLLVKVPQSDATKGTDGP